MPEKMNAGFKRLHTSPESELVRNVIRLSGGSQDAMEEARVASGRLSKSLYLDLLFQQILAERGTLPIFSLSPHTSEAPSVAA